MSDQNLLERLQNVQNGRVNTMNKQPKKQFNVFNQRSNGNQLFKTEAIKNIHSETKLTQIFFSKQNIDLIQDLIRTFGEEVKKNIQLDVNPIYN